MKIRVVIADDHTVLRAGLRALINAESDMDVVGEASDGDEAVTIVSAVQPDVVLLDLTMPRRDGLSAIPNIRKACPRTQVLALSMHDDPSYLRAVLAAGGSGYVVKTAEDAELLAAIRAVAQGRTFVDLSLGENAHGGLLDQTSMDPPHAVSSLSLLSAREHEVLELVAQGHTNQKVADRLKLSVKSVETYRARVMEKLNLKSRADLVRFALECGLLAREKLDTHE